MEDMYAGIAGIAVPPTGSARKRRRGTKRVKFKGGAGIPHEDGNMTLLMRGLKSGWARR